MKKPGDNIAVFTRRSFVLGAAQLSALGLLGGRLAWLQMVQGNRYKTLSDKNRINIKLLAPSRGEIVDRYGNPLAVNNQNFRVLVIPEQTDDIRHSLLSLKKLIGLSDPEIEKILKRASKTASFVPIEIKDALSWEEVAKIEVHLPDLPGLLTDEGEIRNYPYQDSTAHIVGYVGSVSRADLTGDPVLKLPGFKIGKTGIEKQFDKEMRGEAGSSEVEVNVRGREVRELVHNPSQTGREIKLTIDIHLQKYMQERLNKEKSASAVVLDAKTGAVYALASSPGFDPNLFTQGLSANMWEKMLADPGYPLTNKAIAGQYPPGSTFKMVTALAALEAGIIDSKRKVFCPGFYEYGNDRFHCWKAQGHGHVDLVSALAQSCDTFFYKISTELGVEKISEMAKRLGLGSKLDFDLKEERPGLIPNKDWKMGHFGEHWRAGETVVASIGQGYIQTTPLQLAIMTARLVNGGMAVKPWMSAYAGEQSLEGTPPSSLGFKKWHLDLIRKGMDNAVNTLNGTAYSSIIEEKNMRMGGKTGTAQVKRITREQRAMGLQNEDLPWKHRHHALFVGYAPIDDPRYVVSVVVEHGVAGSKTAAPLARELLVQAQKRNPAAHKITISSARNTENDQT